MARVHREEKVQGGTGAGIKQNIGHKTRSGQRMVGWVQSLHHLHRQPEQPIREEQPTQQVYVEKQGWRAGQPYLSPVARKVKEEDRGTVGPLQGFGAGKHRTQGQPLKDCQRPDPWGDHRTERLRVFIAPHQDAEPQAGQRLKRVWLPQQNIR